MTFVMNFFFFFFEGVPKPGSSAQLSGIKFYTNNKMRYWAAQTWQWWACSQWSKDSKETNWTQTVICTHHIHRQQYPCFHTLFGAFPYTLYRYRIFFLWMKQVLFKILFQYCLMMKHKIMWFRNLFSWLFLFGTQNTFCYLRFYSWRLLDWILFAQSSKKHRNDAHYATPHGIFSSVKLWVWTLCCDNVIHYPSSCHLDNLCFLETCIEDEAGKIVGGWQKT